MAKRTTDLLDVFRTSGEQGAPPSRGPKKAKRGSRGGDGGFEGVFLGPRQLLLAGCVLLLLLVLAFVLGLGLRRRGQGLSAESSLSRTTRTEAFYVLGRLAQRRVLGGDRIAPEEIAPQLGLPPQNVRVEERRGDMYDVYVGPFPTEREAEAFRAQRLAGIGFGGNWPFSDVLYKIVRLPRPSR